MALVSHPNLVVFVVERQSLRLVGDVLTQQHLDDMAGSCDPLVAADYTAEQQLKVRIETRDQCPLPDEGKQRLRSLKADMGPWRVIAHASVLCIGSRLLVLKADMRPRRVGANTSILCTVIRFLVLKIGIRQERVVDDTRNRVIQRLMQGKVCVLRFLGTLEARLLRMGAMVL